ncbi:TIGR04222 domain-containing membrane protein [Kitasatospora sp. NPDC058162]|uniref:TIGR04222 domain-containing membrane protein n=1 Tax=Kitasatospora sp. NPDC058162 TaxID=3346362 RepID=UPI0036D83464
MAVCVGLLVFLAAYLVGTALWCRAARAELYRVERSLAGPPEAELEVYELAGIADHLAQLLLLEAFERGAVSVRGGGYLVAEGRPGGRGFYAALLAAAEARTDGDLLAVEARLGRQPALRAFQAGLAERGLVRDPGLRRRLNRAAGWGSAGGPLLVVSGVVGVGWVVAEHRNVLLPAGAFVLLIALLLLVGDRVFRREPRHATDHGEQLLRLARSDPAWRDLQGRVALYGYYALPEGHLLKEAWQASRARREEERRRAAESRGDGGGLGGI